MESSAHWSDFLVSSEFAKLLGFLSTICFTLQYLPQIFLNFSRKSVKGFSAIGIIIKHVGASFLFVNSLWSGEVLAVVLYGLFNVVQHSMFMFQFAYYPHLEDGPNNEEVKIVRTPSQEKAFKEKYLLWLMFPAVPAVLAAIAPSTMKLTNSVKPITQVLSHLPQLRVCYELKTTNGVSLTSQHLNMIGGICGLYMCWIVPPVSWSTYIIYFNSILQAGSLYAMAFYYDRFCIKSISRGRTEEVHFQ
eukprot:TRINITY_DN4027_c0_g1_i3.p1 TRINITY_DN4027_c0_g1~~TRINITY_DN4027_c0_g1_i3.p1  ORF type:complete len:247 (-),score=42.78 TRINITY_DN4027_c0_g1_i3:227-967(-)